jgi:hypothetical protein
MATEMAETKLSIGHEVDSAVTDQMGYRPSESDQATVEYLIDRADERAVLRKIDWIVMPAMTFVYFFQCEKSPRVLTGAQKPNHEQISTSKLSTTRPCLGSRRIFTSLGWSSPGS